jgi:non-ribosomal peptide synthetase-like protein
VLEKSVDVLTVDLAKSTTAEGTYVGPTTGTEQILADVLADVVNVERVSVDSHFFDDLGANSLVMAHFCARVRKRDDLPSVSMKDIYRNPTIKSLAEDLAEVIPAPAETPVATSTEATVAAPTPASTPRYILCGVLQLLTFVGYTFLLALLVTAGYEWIASGTGLIDYYLRAVIVGGAAVLAPCILSVVAKWMLVGRWKPREIRIWSLGYVRFWLAKTLVQRNPVVLLFIGSPLYSLYLRALGAKVGRGVAIFSRTVPVCTDLLTIGDGTVVRKDSHLTCYRAHDGLIQTGPVTLGKDVFIGEMTVVDIGTSMGDGAQLGHTSSLHTGQAVPDGEHWHGSPAQKTDVNYRTVEPADCGMLRRVVYSVLQVLNLVIITLPLGIGLADVALREVPRLASLEFGPHVLTSWTFYVVGLVVSFGYFFGVLLVGLIVVATVPRLLSLALKPDKVYRLYGIHYTTHRLIARLTNNRFFKILFGDSSSIVHYLRYLGYRLPNLEQTGSNFGTILKHGNPYLSTVGRGTMVADGLSIINADFSSSSFRLSATSIGPQNFLGNVIAYPSQGKTGDNCLIATKAMVPIEGEIREGIGLLGSPSFEIPRSVQRDTRFDPMRTGDALRGGIAAKNRHNAVTATMFLVGMWIYVYGLTLLAWTTTRLYGVQGTAVIAAASVLTLVWTTLYFVLFERAVQVFLPLRPMYCSIYDRRFWRHERYWKSAAVTAYLHAFDGTPFKSGVWRLLGVRLGRRVFDDGCSIPEKTLVTIGDDTTINFGAAIQCHSQEDGAFKSDRIRIGAGCTVGVGAWVHYGVTMGDGVVLGPDSFLMKGEDVPPHAWWAGNPARDLREDRVLNMQICRAGQQSRTGQHSGGK